MSTLPAPHEVPMSKRIVFVPPDWPAMKRESSDTFAWSRSASWSKRLARSDA